MSSPRFLLSATTGASSTRTYWWRLLAGNNHLLGRCPAGSHSEGACWDSVARLLAKVDEGTLLPAAESLPGRWGWQLVLELNGEREVLAISGRHYARQRESKHNAELFLAAVPSAVLEEVVVMRARSYEHRGSRVAVPAQRSSQTGARA